MKQVYGKFMPTVKDNLKDAWETEDYINLKRLVDFLRSKGYTYIGTKEAIERAISREIEDAEYAEVMLELDNL